MRNCLFAVKRSFPRRFCRSLKPMFFECSRDGRKLPPLLRERVGVRANSARTKCLTIPVSQPARNETFETETDISKAIFLTNQRTFLRRVSFFRAGMPVNQPHPKRFRRSSKPMFVECSRDGRKLFPLPRAAETQSLAAHGASLGQGEGQTGSLCEVGMRTKRVQNAYKNANVIF
jgi:hypothetical protein